MKTKVPVVTVAEPEEAARLAELPLEGYADCHLDHRRARMDRVGAGQVGEGEVGDKGVLPLSSSGSEGEAGWECFRPLKRPVHPRRGWPFPRVPGVSDSSPRACWRQVTAAGSSEYLHARDVLCSAALDSVALGGFARRYDRVPPRI